jgi:hypothetical protein
MERKIILRRLFQYDEDLYKIGRLAGLDWFNRFEAKFKSGEYPYFTNEEREEAIERIASELPDSKFIEVVNNVFKEAERRLKIDRFVGEHYYFDVSAGLKLDNKQEELKKEIWEVLEITNGRTYHFLKAIIELRKEGRWDEVYGGADWWDIMAKIRELKGTYPLLPDLATLKLHKIYYKTGSTRHRTYTVPEETIPVVEEVLERYIKNHQS